jgi:hypothetical protein
MKAIPMEPNIVSTGVVWMLLHIDGKFTTRKLKSSLLLKRLRSMYEVDMAALMVSLSWSSGRQMQSKYSINHDLFNEARPTI